MPIDLNDSLNNISARAFGSPVISGALGNVLSCAAILSIIAIVLIMFIYPAKSGTSFVVVVKIFIYMFAASAALIFIHDGIRSKRSAYQNTASDQYDLVTQSNPADRDVIYSQDSHEVRPEMPNRPYTGGQTNTSNVPVVQQITIQAPNTMPTAPAPPTMPPPVQLPKYVSDRISGGGSNSYSQMNTRVRTGPSNPYAS